MAAEALLAFVSYRPSEDADGIDARREHALVGAMLVNEAIGHLRVISRSELNVRFVDHGGPYGG